MTAIRPESGERLTTKKGFSSSGQRSLVDCIQPDLVGCSGCLAPKAVALVATSNRIDPHARHCGSEV